MVRKIVDDKLHCHSCDQWLTLDNFTKDSSRAVGYRIYCRACALRRWPRDKAKTKAYSVRYFADPVHRDKRRAVSTRWAKDNAERKLAYDRAYREANKAKLAARRAQWLRNNPDKLAQYNARAYVKRKAKAVSRCGSGAIGVAMSLRSR